MLFFVRTNLPLCSPYNLTTILAQFAALCKYKSTQNIFHAIIDFTSLFKIPYIVKTCDYTSISNKLVTQNHDLIRKKGG
nr:MAG TPA: hypothetical protein [Caudoviricetes sp.]